MQRLLSLAVDHFCLHFDYNPLLNTKLEKEVGGCYRKHLKYFEVALVYKQEVYDLCREYSFDITDECYQYLLKKGLDYKHVQEREVQIYNYPYPESLQSLIKKTPYSFQKEGIAYCLHKRDVLLADDMGLGKCLQSISTITFAQQSSIQLPCLIICPNSLKYNWQDEWTQLTGYKASVFTDKTEEIDDVMIINYEQLKKWFCYDVSLNEKNNKLYIQLNTLITQFNSLIIDESHLLRNSSSQRTKIVLKLANEIKGIKLCLTGTPIVNQSSDIIPQLTVLDHFFKLGGYKWYADKFSQGRNKEELYQVLRDTCLIRRTKKEVLKELPDKTRQIIKVDITTQKEYNKALNEFKKYLLENRHKTNKEVRRSMYAEALSKVHYLREISALGKIDDVVEQANLLTEAGEKVIIFAHHKVVIEELQKQFKNCLTIDGSKSAKDRQNTINLFQSDKKYQVIICSLKAANYGITLTQSCNVFFVETNWTYAECCQAEDRAHRIGQYKDVICKYFFGRNTIDEKIYHIIMDKKDLSDQIIKSTDFIMSLFDC